MVGGVIAADLARTRGWRVTVLDRSADALERAGDRAQRFGARVTTAEADLSDAKSIKAAIEPADVVVGALPSTLGFNALRTVIEAKRPYADISFMPENALELGPLARRRGVTAIVDIGVAPGMSNLLAGWAATRLDPCERIAIYVGGLPVERRLPFQYKAAFSPADVLEEYTRPVRLVEGGRTVIRTPLSEPEPVEFEGIGTLEAFNTDGLRTMAATLKVPNMKEKTLRYPGHIEKMAVLRETGFFRTDPIDVGGVKVRPLDVTAKLLFPMWKLEPGEADITVLKVIVEGTKAGKRTRLTYDLVDAYDPTTGVHSMARTTGYTATAAVRMLARGLFTDKGVFSPELVGQKKPCVDFLLSELRARGVIYKETIEFL